MDNPFELILERLGRIDKAIRKLEIGKIKAPINSLLDDNIKIRKLCYKK